MHMIEELRSLKNQLLFDGSFEHGTFKNIVIAGMGGSGIAGSIFAELYHKHPVCTLSDYSVPAYVDSDTLFIAISYSGNTEETISAYREAEMRGARMVAITSGGELEKMCKSTVKIPSGLQPRSALGYMLSPIVRSMVDDGSTQLKEAASVVKAVDEDTSSLRGIAESMVASERIPIILGYSPYSSVAYRWQTQFNENAKILAFSSSFPELDHNQIVALGKSYGLNKFQFFVFGGSTGRVRDRIQFTLDLAGIEAIEIPMAGKSPVARTMHFVHTGDYISYFAALSRKVEPADVAIIEELKRLLAGI